MRRVGLLAMLLPACFTLPDYDGPLGSAAADEDSDGIRNADDLCPHIGGASQVDSDIDGVGNACDPNPGMQDMHAFYGFDALALGDLSTIGRIQANDSFVEIGTTGAVTYNGVDVPLQLSRVEMEMRFFAKDGLDTIGDGIGFRLGHYGSQVDDAGYCIFGVEPNDRAELTATYRSPNSAPSETTGPIASLPFKGVSGRMHASLTATQLTCTVDQLTQPGAEFDPISISVTLDAPPAIGTSGIFASNAIVYAEYLFITGLP